MAELDRLIIPEARPRILLVEGEAAIRHLFLASFGEFNLAVAASAKRAIEMLEQKDGEFAAVLATAALPDGCGIELLKRVREHYPDTARLLSVDGGTGLDRVIHAVNEAGVSALISRPWSLAELRTTLQRAEEAWLQRRRDRELITGRRAVLLSLASSIAHEMRTPLATIRLRAWAMARHWPALMSLCEEAIASGRMPDLSPSRFRMFRDSPDVIGHEVDRTNLMIDMLLAPADSRHMDNAGFASHRIVRCVREALDGYVFEPGARRRVLYREDVDFSFHGSNVLVVFILYNLLKNALHAIASVEGGKIEIWAERGSDVNTLFFRDTGTGIAAEHLPRIFDDFYTTKATGTGVGLSYCRNAMRSMGGDIECLSREGEFTLFLLRFPTLAE